MEKMLLTKSFRILTVVFLCICFFPIVSYSQVASSQYVVVDFMKVKPSDHIKYLELEQEIWKPMHQERINQGIIVGWFLYAVEFTGSAEDYNYVAITLYDNSGNLENPWLAEIPENVHKGMKLEDMLEQTYKVRDHVKSELFYSVATAPEVPLKKPASYMQANFMYVEPGKQSEYESLESEIWLPIHNRSIQLGRTSGWGLWALLFPRGAGRSYQYITLNSFSEFSTIFELDFSVSFNEIHPDRDFSGISQKTQQSRKIIRSELWYLIDYVVK